MGSYMPHWTQEQTQHALIIQLSVSLMALEALIANHPDPESVRRSFDQMFGQLQANSLATGAANPEALEIARKVADRLFAQ